MLKKIFLFSILLSSLINLNLKTNEFDKFEDTYTSIFGEQLSSVWEDKDSCKECYGGY